MQTGKVLVLNSDYSYLNVVSFRRASKYVLAGKAAVESLSEARILTASGAQEMPLVVRFLYFIKKTFKATVRWSKKAIHKRDNYTCAYCSRNFSKDQRRLTVDHIVPASRGGLTNFENTVSSCARCNRTKGARTPDEAGMQLQRKPSTRITVTVVVREPSPTIYREFNWPA